MAEVMKIKSKYVREQAEKYLSETTLDDVLTNFIYNQDMGMFNKENEVDIDSDDPFDYYEQVNNKNTELKQMVLKRIKELID